MMDRAVPFARVIDGVVPHFVSRTIFTGSGKVGVETSALDADTVHFQISQRAEFFEEIVGLETTLKRPIVNTRDEPHADPKRFRRLHVIVGDANLSEIATLLKVGSTAIVLAMVEDEAGPERDLTLSDPVRALHQVSADLSLSRPLALADGSTATALEMQWEIFGAARKYAEEHGLSALGDDGEVGALIMGHWESVLGGLESDPAALSDTLDWVAKQQLLLAYQERHGCGWGDPRLAALALQYHDLRPDRSIYQRLGLRRLVTEAEAARAVTEPPPGTRAWFRGKCLARWPDAVVTANWDSLVFDIGTDPLRRVPMMDPLKGTAEHTGALLAESTSPADLLERLNS
jgi:Pup amidohydrolase